MLNTIIRLLMLPFSFIIGGNKYFKAKKLEEEKNYKKACYTYAVAILNGGVINEKAVYNKIKTLWIQHGPFNYEEDIRNVIAEDRAVNSRRPIW